MSSNHLFCFGLGFSAQALARRLLDQGWRVSGTCRSPAKLDVLRQGGISAYLLDDQAPLAEPETALAGVTHLLSSVPPGNGGDPVLLAHGKDIAALAGQLRWIGYLSTVGVYGDHDGRWIDESCEPQPVSNSSRRRLEAENAWLALASGMQVEAHLFRLPGIYGPGTRNQISALRAGRARRIVKPGQVFNRIHVADIARTLVAAIGKPGGSCVYNVTDDEPAPADQVVEYAAQLIGIDPPPAEDFERAELSTFARHFYAECKRVKNDLIKSELGVELQYPSYREGLAAIAAAQD